jgi:hemerythrin superfamily protein
MATAMKKMSPVTESPTKAKDATALLRADHKVISDLFSKYEKTRSVSKKKEIVDQLYTQLSVHTKIEEIFYPEVKLTLKDR